MHHLNCRNAVLLLKTNFVGIYIHMKIINEVRASRLVKACKINSSQIPASFPTFFRLLTENRVS